METQYDRYFSLNGFNISCKYILNDNELDEYLILFTKERTYEKYLLKLSYNDCLKLGGFFLSLINIKKDLDNSIFSEGIRTIEERVNDTIVKLSISLDKTDQGCIIYIYNDFSPNFNLRLECNIIDALFLGKKLIDVFIKQYYSNSFVLPKYETTT